MNFGVFIIIKAFGDNKYGQLGLGCPTEIKKIPVCISRVYLKHRYYL